MARIENEYGLTYEEWLAAAGGAAHVAAVIRPGASARTAWREGDDPSDFRAADEQRALEIKARQQARRQNLAGGGGRSAYAMKVERALARFGFMNSRAMIEQHHEAITGAYKLGEPAAHVARRIAGMPAYPSSRRSRGVKGTNMARGVPDVDRFHTPPRNQGQIVEVSYGASPDFAVMRSYDRSDGDTTYFVAPWTKKLSSWWESVGPWNDVPPVTNWRRLRSTSKELNMTHESNNRAKSPARSRLGKKALPKSTEVKIASLHHVLDRLPSSDAFVTVKGGRIYARYRRPGRGLGKAELIGTLPEFKKGLFYFVRGGAIYARKRK